jgi:predicted nucleic acid-binding protein
VTAVLSDRASRQYVLDANALSGFFEDRAGTAGRMEKLLSEALRRASPLFMSAINWGEVFYVAWRLHGEQHARQAEARLHELPIAVISADQERASRAGAIKQKYGLGYADSFAAELAIERDAWLVTADEEFRKVGKILSLYALPRHESK